MFLWIWKIISFLFRQTSILVECQMISALKLQELCFPWKTIGKMFTVLLLQKKKRKKNGKKWGKKTNNKWSSINKQRKNPTHNTVNVKVCLVLKSHRATSEYSVYLHVSISCYNNEWPLTSIMMNNWESITMYRVIREMKGYTTEASCFKNE